MPLFLFTETFWSLSGHYRKNGHYPIAKTRCITSARCSAISGMKWE
jgi:hypothetical protein